MTKRKLIIFASLTAAGIAGGLIYWQFWGCTDSCPLWSKAHWMAIRGGLVGLCLGLVFISFKKKTIS